ncbi:uncharacterized protein EKO05_0009567 [Ascochyta rabiei]|uniref:Uncharacterized protein n=1 Tax=Didymella rabiei TaxID=5454 RepID=A0A163CS96_DIDRA|nr:uncharacterized protein EKO05_0009567 [Ascochyta rabiei]KZM22657.1 hypothetical protein ST47_g6304 [Ascochyta rabiei]UPX19299.1 hypothetical protein EKO05_0009567 [Ascochyta rabiei]
MKVFRLAALFGGAASAVQPLVGRDDGTTTTVIYTTSTYTITKCAASVTNCPVASATEVFTSTTVMSVTTTICPVTSTPGLQPPGPGYMPSSVLSSALPTNSPGTTGTLPDAVPTSYSPAVSVSSGAYVPPVQSSALPTGSSRSIDFSVSLISPDPSLPVTGTDSIPASTPSDASGPPSMYTPPAQTSTQPTGPSGSDTVVVPRPSLSGSASLPGSLTDSIPTSFPPGMSPSASSNGYDPPQLSTTAWPGSSQPTTGTNTGAVLTSDATPSSGYGQSSAPSNTATDAVPTSGYPASSTNPSSGVYSQSASSNTAAVPTSGYPGSNAVPSGSNLPSVSSYTATDSMPTSGSPGSSGAPSSGAYLPSLPSNTNTDAVPTSGYQVSSSTGPVGTNTGSVPTSLGPSASGPPSSGYTAPETTALPTQGTASIPQGYSSGSAPVVPSGSLSTVSGTYPAVTSISSGMVYPGHPSSSASTTVIDGTTRITSRLTLTSTSYITALLPSSNSLIDTATDAVTTSRGTEYLPSGSGYPYPSGSANGTIITPTPSYIEVPVNMGQIIAVGRSPIEAIVIALALALFA